MLERLLSWSFVLAQVLSRNGLTSLRTVTKTCQDDNSPLLQDDAFLAMMDEAMRKCAPQFIGQ